VTFAAQDTLTGTGDANEDWPKYPPPMIVLGELARTKLGSLAPEVRRACWVQKAGWEVVQ
jgi:hypothetical protein